jgi:hypothetical protein
MTMQPRKGFDWNHVSWGKPDSPRSALCSYCSAGIGEDDVPLILSSNNGHVAQFCDDCMRKWWGTGEINNQAR